MLFAEALVLISLAPEGQPARSGTSSYVDVGAAGALVAELTLHGSVTLEDGRISMQPAAPPQHPLLAAAESALAAREGKKLTSSFGKITKTTGRAAVIDSLVASGKVGRERSAWFRTTRHPVLDRIAYESLLSRLRAEAIGSGELSAADAVVLALAGPCRLLEVVAPERSDRAAAKRRMAEAARSVPVAGPVRRAIEDAIAASTAAVAAVATAAAVASD